MTTRTFLCDLGWTVAKLELDTGDDQAETPADHTQDTLTLLQPADGDSPAQSLALVSREALLQLRDFIDESLAANDSPPENGEP